MIPCIGEALTGTIASAVRSVNGCTPDMGREWKQRPGWLWICTGTCSNNRAAPASRGRYLMGPHSNAVNNPLQNGGYLNQELVKRVGAAGIGSMRRGIRCSKGWRKQREKRGTGCGPIRSRCRRGSGGRDAVRTSGKSLRYMTVLRPVSRHLSPRLETSRAENSLM